MRAIRFSTLKSSKNVIPPHRAQSPDAGKSAFRHFQPKRVQGGAQCGGISFSAFSARKAEKGDSPAPGPGVQGGAQMRGNQLFGIFSPEKLKKVIPSQGGVWGSAFRHFQP